MSDWIDIDTIVNQLVSDVVEVVKGHGEKGSVSRAKTAIQKHIESEVIKALNKQLSHHRKKAVLKLIEERTKTRIDELDRIMAATQPTKEQDRYYDERIKALKEDKKQ